MKHIKTINESQGEYLLVIHHESGDEIHFHVLELSCLSDINNLIGSGNPSYVQSEELSDYIQQNELDSLMCQTYVLEDYFVNKYNFSKVIYIPDLGF